MVLFFPGHLVSVFKYVAKISWLLGILENSWMEFRVIDLNLEV